MKLNRIFKLATKLCAALSFAAPGLAFSADSFPERPVEIVVGFSAGGPADTIGRVLSERLGQELGKSVVIVNRPGADGVVAASHVARSNADGYTLLLAPSTLAINESLYANINYSAPDDFVPVSFIGQSPNIIAVHPSVPVNSLGELVDYAKSAEQPLFYGSSSSVTMLATELLKLQTDIDMERVPYKGAGQAIPGLLAGDVQVMISSVLTLLPHVESGGVRALAVTSEARLPNAGDIPTVIEQGLPEYEASTWYGLFAPSDTPQRVIDIIDAAMQSTLTDETVLARFEEQGMVTESSIKTQADFKAYFEDEISKWEKVVISSGTQIN